MTWLGAIADCRVACRCFVAGESVELGNYAQAATLCSARARFARFVNLRANRRGWRNIAVEVESARRLHGAPAVAAETQTIHTRAAIAGSGQALETVRTVIAVGQRRYFASLGRTGRAEQ